MYYYFAVLLEQKDMVDVENDYNFSVNYFVLHVTIQLLKLLYWSLYVE